MFAAKILKKMASPGLTFGEHCANFAGCSKLLKVLQRNAHKQIATMFMRNAGHCFIMYAAQSIKRRGSNW
jgi:hypothetical protein